MEEEIGRKVLWRLVLPSALFILIGSIDRANVGFAALQMNESLGLSGSQYGFVAGILFVGYVLAKYPSVLLYEEIGMRRWLGVITLFWGVAASAMSLVQTEWHLYTLRVIIGFAEGGLSSGLMIYLSHWASERYRATVLALPIMAISVAQVVGAPISGLLMEVPNPLGWEGWRWMFLVEGMPAILLGIFAWFYYPESPDEAKWLDGDEKAWMRENIRGASKPRKGERHPDRWAVLRLPVGWVSGLIWFCILASNYGVMFWLPRIVGGMTGLSPAQTGVVVALPWAGSAIGLYLNARHSDKVQERFMHIAFPALIGGVGLLAAYIFGSGVPGLLALVIGGACVGSTVAAFWAIPTRLLPPAALPMGIVFINIIGSCAGGTVPALMGYLRDISGSFLPPTLLLVGIQLALVILCLIGRNLERDVLAREPVTTR
ncbi:MAG: MFS transporter [Sphingomonadaceae bacterium]